MNIIKRSNKRPSAVNDILSTVLNKKHITKKAKSFSFLDKWEEIVGKDIAEISAPERLNKGILTVRVIDAVYAQELSFNKVQYLEKLSGLGYAGAVSDIHFIVGNPRNFK